MALAISPAAWPPMPSATMARLPLAAAWSCGVIQATASSLASRTRPGSVRIAPTICMERSEFPSRASAGRSDPAALRTGRRARPAVRDVSGLRSALRLQQLAYAGSRHGERYMLGIGAAHRQQPDDLAGRVEHRTAAAAGPGKYVELIHFAEGVLDLDGAFAVFLLDRRQLGDDSLSDRRLGDVEAAHPVHPARVGLLDAKALLRDARI